MMYDYDTRHVDEITGVTPETRDRLLRWYARQPEPVRIEAHKIQTDLLRQTRNSSGQGGKSEAFHPKNDSGRGSGSQKRQPYT